MQDITLNTKDEQKLKRVLQAAKDLTSSQKLYDEAVDLLNIFGFYPEPEPDTTYNLQLDD